MKSVRFHPDAETEMMEAAAYYEAQQPKLGRRFLATVQDAANRIAVDPHHYPIVELDVRRCLTKIFPYGILFREAPADSPSPRLLPATSSRAPCHPSPGARTAAAPSGGGAPELQRPEPAWLTGWSSPETLAGGATSEAILETYSGENNRSRAASKRRASRWKNAFQA